MTTAIPITPCSLATPDSGESFYFRDSARGAGGRFSFQWRLAPGSVGPGPHSHPHETEHFTVVSGRLQIWFEGTCHELGPGESLAVPAGVVHHFGHPGEEEAVVEVWLDGPRMEDQFVPIAVLFDSPTTLPLRAVPLVLTHIAAAMAGGSSVPASALLRGMIQGMAAIFRLFGARPLPPVHGWDAIAPAA